MSEFTWPEGHRKSNANAFTGSESWRVNPPPAPRELFGFQRTDEQKKARRAQDERTKQAATRVNPESHIGYADKAGMCRKADI